MTTIKNGISKIEELFIKIDLAIEYIAVRVF
jgi:hypothetical protein